jgi:hypothetical protein
MKKVIFMSALLISLVSVHQNFGQSAEDGEKIEQMKASFQAKYAAEIKAEQEENRKNACDALKKSLITHFATCHSSSSIFDLKRFDELKCYELDGK